MKCTPLGSILVCPIPSPLPTIPPAIHRYIHQTAPHPHPFISIPVEISTSVPSLANQDPHCLLHTNVQIQGISATGHIETVTFFFLSCNIADLQSLSNTSQGRILSILYPLAKHTTAGLKYAQFSVSELLDFRSTEDKSRWLGVDPFWLIIQLLISIPGHYLLRSGSLLHLSS